MNNSFSGFNPYKSTACKDNLAVQHIFKPYEAGYPAINRFFENSSQNPYLHKFSVYYYRDPVSHCPLFGLVMGSMQHSQLFICPYILKNYGNYNSSLSRF